MIIQNIVKNMFTESDNQTFDGVRITAFITIFSAIGMAGYSIYKGSPFDMMSYGTGMGALFGGLGVALGMKKDTQNVSNN